MAEAELTRAGPASIARERRTPARCGRRCEMRSGGGGCGGGGGGYSTYSTTPSTLKSSENETYSVSREGGGDEVWVAVRGAAGAATSAMTLAWDMSHGLDEPISAMARERITQRRGSQTSSGWSQGGRVAVPLIPVGAPVLPELTERILELERGGEEESGVSLNGSAQAALGKGDARGSGGCLANEGGDGGGGPQRTVPVRAAH